MDIREKVAVVTGGASGLGRATAEMVIANGGQAVLLDRNEALVHRAVEELGPSASPSVADVTDEASVEAAIAAVVERFGNIHINVNCAGIGAAARTVGRDGPLPLAAFGMVIQVNLIGTFNTLRCCADAMQKNEDEERGVIVNTASVAAFDGQIGQAAYSASKGGVVGMTLPIARDLARSGIRVCTIAHLRDPDDGRGPARRARPVDRDDAVSQAAGRRLGVRPARPADRREPVPQRRDDPHRRRHPDGAALIDPVMSSLRGSS